MSSTKRHMNEAKASTPVKKKRHIEYTNSLPGLPQPDPEEPGDDILDNYPVELHDIIREHWSVLRTRYRLRKVNRVMSTYNFRLGNMHVDEHELRDYVKSIYRHQKSAFKIQLYFSSILRHIETGDLRLFAGNPNFQTLIPKPMMIANISDLEQCLSAISNQDFSEVISQERPDTKWVALGVFTFHIATWKYDATLIGAHGSLQPLPNFIKKNKNILTLVCDTKGRSYSDIGCFFVALASATSNFKKDVRKLANRMQQIYQQKKLQRNFNGFVRLDDFDVLEQMFKVKVNLYTLKQRNTKKGGSFLHAQTVRVAKNNDPDALVMHCDLQGTHLSLIKNINNYAKQFQCDECKSLFANPSKLQLHKKKRWCWTEPKPIYKAGNYDVDAENVFEQLSRKGIHLRDPLDRFETHFCALDFETFNVKEYLQISDKVTYTNRLELLCGAIASTLDPSTFEGAFFGRQEGQSTETLLCSILEHLAKIKEEKEKQRTQKLQYVIGYCNMDSRIREMLEKQRRKISCGAADDDPMLIFVTDELAQLNKLKEKLLGHCKQLIVFGYNSARFDWKIARNELVKMYGEKNIPMSVIKDKRGYQHLKLGDLCLRDCCSLLAPGISLKAFLKSQNTAELEEQKLEFPHSWLCSIVQLQQENFPPIEAFYNELKDESMIMEDYLKLRAIFESKCKTMYDYMRIYNIRGTFSNVQLRFIHDFVADVAPLVRALAKLRNFWQSLEVDLLYDGISLPGLSHKYLHRKLKSECPGLIFWLPAKRDEQILSDIDKGLQGGYHEKDVTKIRKNNGLTCKTCLGFDANSMYLKALSCEMPLSIPALWKRDETSEIFIRKRLVAPGTSSSEVQFCLHLELYEHQGYFVRHRYNSTQLRVGNYSLDAAVEELKIGYLFMGCFWHKHRRCLNSIHAANYSEAEIVEKEMETEERVNFFKSIGYHCIVIWECVWKNTKKSKDFEEFLNNTYHLPKVNKKNCTQKDLIRYILNDEVFGVVSGVDIHVPTEFFDYFSDMAPLFEHRTITEDDLCSYMKQIHEKANSKFQPRKTLVGGFVAKNATYATPLLRYLMLKGCRVDSIKSFIQYKPYKAFENVAEFLTTKRIECEQNANTKVLADFYKLIGNSLYGKNLEAKSKFLNVKFMPEAISCPFIMKPQFKYLEEFENGWSEVGMLRKRYKTDTLRVVGLFVLHYSKQILLSFLYDFIDKFISRQHYDILSVNTDCYYLALSGLSLEELVPESKKLEYEEASQIYLANQDDAVDRRTPGKWKLEWQGIGYIGLAPKLTYGYTITDEALKKELENLPESEQNEVIEKLTSKNKWSAKGVQRRNKLTYLNYLHVLQNQTETKIVENKGLRWYRNAMRSYSILKTGLTAYFYKRKLLAPDGIRTECLDV